MLCEVSGTDAILVKAVIRLNGRNSKYLVWGCCGISRQYSSFGSGSALCQKQSWRHRSYVNLLAADRQAQIYPNLAEKERLSGSPAIV